MEPRAAEWSMTGHGYYATRKSSNILVLTNSLFCHVPLCWITFALSLVRNKRWFHAQMWDSGISQITFQVTSFSEDSLEVAAKCIHRAELKFILIYLYSQQAFHRTQNKLFFYWITISLVEVSAKRLISTDGRSLQHSSTAWWTECFSKSAIKSSLTGVPLSTAV